MRETFGSPTYEERIRTAERERCAMVAEAWHPALYAPELAGAHPRDAALIDAKREIAAAIRKSR